jgi:hypothetical protein
MRGQDGSTGIGLVEVYDLAPATASQVANISSRGFVDTGDNAMIGGFIVGGASSGGSTVVVRGIGPSLQSAGVANALSDPALEVRDANGALLAANNGWKETQQAQIQATGIAPTSDLEPAALLTLAAGSYTAVVRGQNNTTGVGSVEVYNVP